MPRTAFDEHSRDEVVNTTRQLHCSGSVLCHVQTKVPIPIQIADKTFTRSKRKEREGNEIAHSFAFSFERTGNQRNEVPD